MKLTFKNILKNRGFSDFKKMFFTDIFQSLLILGNDEIRFGVTKLSHACNRYEMLKLEIHFKNSIREVHLHHIDFLFIECNLIFLFERINFALYKLPKNCSHIQQRTQIIKMNYLVEKRTGKCLRTFT